MSVSQVVLASEGQLTHTRLLHAQKVGILAGELAQDVGHILEPDTVEYFGGLDRFAAECGGLAHDLGHPPFGHVGEQAINAAIRAAQPSKPEQEAPEIEGYEGNAQAYRIVTRLAMHKQTDRNGLNLTRASLNAMQKYPWTYDHNSEKYGAYRSELPVLQDARSYVEHLGRRRTLEAELVDIADDITYAVHDLEDFYRAGLIPLERLRNLDENTREVRELIDRAVAERKKVSAIQAWMGGSDQTIADLTSSAPEPDSGMFSYAWTKDVGGFPIYGPYEGRTSQRGALRDYTAGLIKELVASVEPNEQAGVALSEEALVSVLLLKQLTRTYVIRGSALGVQQIGQIRILETLFEFYMDNLCSRALHLFPGPFRDEAEVAVDATQAEQVRFVADLVAAATEDTCVRNFRIVTGIDLGRVLGP